MQLLPVPGVTLMHVQYTFEKHSFHLKFGEICIFTFLGLEELDENIGTAVMQKA